jgi:hypothetical protein
MEIDLYWHPGPHPPGWYANVWNTGPRRIIATVGPRKTWAGAFGAARAWLEKHRPERRITGWHFPLGGGKGEGGLPLPEDRHP